MEDLDIKRLFWSFVVILATTFVLACVCTKQYNTLQSQEQTIDSLENQIDILNCQIVDSFGND